jgi:hypothetical protein
MKFIEILLYFFAILNLAFSLKIKKLKMKTKKNMNKKMWPIDVYRKIQVKRSRQNMLKSLMNITKDPKKIQEISKKLDEAKEQLKTLRLKLNINIPNNKNKK